MGGMRSAPSDPGDRRELILRIPARYAAVALAVLFAVISVIVCAHSASAHHDKSCALCAIAGLSSEVPVPAPDLAVLGESPDKVPVRPTQRPIVLATLAFSCRAPPLPTE